MPPSRKSETTVKIRAEDPNFLVLAKPAGLLSQGERTGDENLVDWLRQYLGRPYIGLVHRLDRNTSGLMVVAKRTKAAQRLTRQLKEGRLERRYQAWLIGRLEAPARWEHWLVKDPERNEVRVVSGPRASRNAKKAALEVRPLGTGRFAGLSLTRVELVLETGRSHQIRVQAAASGLPLLGDVKYAGGLKSGARATESRESALFGRPALHSSWLAFDHPISSARVSFEEPLPEDMRTLLAPDGLI